MKLPNFLIIGAGKSGTTSIYHYLKQHPQVYMSPVKETNFFAYEEGYETQHRFANFRVRNFDEYCALFYDVSDQPAIGEASPRYLRSPRAAERIHALIPHAKLIAILRNPVERVYSSYSMHIRDGNETRTLTQAIRDEELGILNENLDLGKLRYLEQGYYAKQLLTYLKLFDRKHIAINLFEDLTTDPKTFMRNLYRFLGVSDAFEADTSIRYNASGVPRHKVLKPLLISRQGSFRRRLTRVVRRILPSWLEQPLLTVQARWQGQQLVKPPMDPEIREKLIIKYRDDVLQLQDILQRDLSHWLR